MSAQQTAVETIPYTASCFGFVLNESQEPARVNLIHNKEDRDKDGKLRKPKGWGIGGGGFKPEVDKTPRHAARREVKDEAGVKTVLGRFFPKSRYGEVILQKKPDTNHEVFTFFLKEVSNGHKIVETDESGANGWFTLANILQMPLAVDRQGEKNSYGIYFSHRERIFMVLKKLGYNFLKLIPNLPELMKKLDHEDVGANVYYILLDAMKGDATYLSPPIAETDAPVPAPAPTKTDENGETAETLAEASWRKLLS